MVMTALHRVLGVTTPDLTFALVEEACRQGLVEQADLDWKRSMPLTQQDPTAKASQQAELAKDIAAQANSGGGMIVYGVEQTRGSGTSGAVRIEPVGGIEESQTKTIRQVAGTLIYPPVTGLRLIPLHPANDPTAGVLVMLVPDSAETPHLVHPRGDGSWFAAPWRDGPDTKWMVERQIATAYRQREQTRRAAAQDLDELYDSFVRRAGAINHLSPWVVAVARPDQPLGRGHRLALDRADSVFARAATLGSYPGLGPLRELLSSDTKRGLRLFTRTSRRQEPALKNAAIRARVELHFDGCVAIGLTRSGGLSPDELSPGHVPIPDLENVGLDLFTLVTVSRHALGVPGEYVGRIGVEPVTQIFRRGDDYMPGLVAPFDEQQRVLDYQPVEGAILLADGNESALDSWIDVVHDAVNQAGAASALSADDLHTRRVKVEDQRGLS